MASYYLECTGLITVVNDIPSCPGGWVTSQVSTDILTITDWMTVWPGIMLMFVTAFGIRILLRMFNVT